MWSKIFVLACLVAVAMSQTASECDYNYFNFYNSYEAGAYFTEQLWDWSGDNFDDGTDDSFDSYFYLDLNVDGNTYSMSNFYSTPTNFTCDIGTTDWESASMATYTYNVTDTIKVHRQFYAPRSGQ